MKTLRKIVFIASNETAPLGRERTLLECSSRKARQQGVQVKVSVKGWGEPVKQMEHLRSLGCQIFLSSPSVACRSASGAGFSAEWI